VRQHLESHGLTIKRVSDNRVLVQTTGTVAQIEEAFAIAKSLSHFEKNP
jgi:very-short-patch-repair endonuclease